MPAGYKDLGAAIDDPSKPPDSLFGVISPLGQTPTEDPGSSPAQTPESERPVTSQDGASERNEASETDEACPSCGAAVPEDESTCPNCGCDIMMARLLGTSTVEEPAPSSTRQSEREPEAEPELGIEPEPEIEPQPEAKSEPEPEPAEASSEDFAASFASAEDPEPGSEFDFGSTLGVMERGDTPSAKPAKRPPAKLPPKQPGPKTAKTSAVASPSRTVRPPSKKRGAGMRVAILGGLGVCVLVALGFAAWKALSSLSVLSNKPPAMAMLVLDWPAKERNMGRVSIDDGGVELPNIGPIEYPMKAGDHRLVLKRVGHEPIQFDFTLGDGERFSYKPEWKLVMFAPETPTRPGRKTGGEIKPAPSGRRKRHPVAEQAKSRATRTGRETGGGDKASDSGRRKRQPRARRNVRQKESVSMKQSGRSRRRTEPGLFSPLGA